MLKLIAFIFIYALISYNALCSSVKVEVLDDGHGFKNFHSHNIKHNGKIIETESGQKNSLVNTKNIIQEGCFYMDNQSFRIVISDSLRGNINDPDVLRKIGDKISDLQKRPLPKFIVGYEFTLRNGIIKTIPFTGRNAK